MTINDFDQSLTEEAPPEGLSLPLQALWHDANGRWEHAHELVQSDADGDGAWVHAYLHRREGDAGNARYWYARVNKPMPDVSLDDERRRIIQALLRNG